MNLAVNHGVDVKRACRFVGLPRSTYYYEATPRTEKPVDPQLRAAVVKIAEERPSFGYRRTSAMVRRALKRPVNEKAVRRVMKQENLTLEPCVQPPRARVRKHPGKLLTEAPDLAYQMDMKYVWCGRDGWAYLQNIVETCTSEWLGYEFSNRCGAREAIMVLDRVTMERFPTTCKAPGTKLRVDNGPGYRADAFTAHASLLGYDVEHIQIRTPEDNGVVESLHAGLERDYFRLLVFDSFDEAAAFIATAFKDYNEVKPQKRLGWRTPKEYYEEVTASAN